MHVRRALFGVAEELGMTPRRARAHYHAEVGDIHQGELERVRAAYAAHLARRRIELADEVGEVDAYLAAYGLVARPEPRP